MAEEFSAKQNGRVVVLYSPVDLPWVGSRFLEQLQPVQIVLIEAELWPNMVAAAKKAGITVAMVNARLSARSERRFQKFGFFIRPVFAMLDQVLVQERGDIPRFAGLGVDPANIHYTGSIKFDPQGAAVDEVQLAQLRIILQQAGIAETQPVLLLASTHAGEEVLLARVALNLNAIYPDLALLIVPRHVERSAVIVEELRPLGIEAQLRSQILSGASGKMKTLLIDTTGELRAWQCLATLVVVGKSFLAEGGQNPAEAVMAQKPVLFGPHMENFEALVDLLLKDKGAVQVSNIESLEAELARLLADKTLRDGFGAAGYRALAAHEGATLQTSRRLFPN
jgi:3-deoxy-D-manno-octulosonic-acid transferase